MEPAEESTSHKKGKKSSHKRKKEKFDEANLPQIQSLTDEQKELLKQFRERVLVLSKDYDDEYKEWASGPFFIFE